MIQKSHIAYFLICVFIFNITGTSGAAESDYIIFYHPRSLHLLNAYEQSLTTGELADLPDFMPAIILNSGIYLSDNYTQAYKIHFESADYFILKSTVTQLTQQQEAVIISNVSTINDTIRVISNTGVYLNTPDDHQGNRIPLPSNTYINRIFRQNDEYYVRVLDSTERYGWVYFGSHKNWQIADGLTIVEKRPISNDVLRIIISKTRNTNDIFAHLFTELNERSGLKFTAPRWTVEQFENSLRLEFKPRELESRYINSNSRFIQEIQYVLLGSRFTMEVTHQPLGLHIYEKKIN